MAKLQIRLDTVEGEPIVFDVESVDFQNLRGLALSVNGEDIVRWRLIVHDTEYQNLHTICYKMGDSEHLKAVEW